MADCYDQHKNFALLGVRSTFLGDVTKSGSLVGVSDWEPAGLYMRHVKPHIRVFVSFAHPERYQFHTNNMHTASVLPACGS